MRNEDTDVSAQIIAHIDSVAWLDQRFYVYRMGHPYAQTSHSLAVSTVDDLEPCTALEPVRRSFAAAGAPRCPHGVPCTPYDRVGGPGLGAGPAR